MHRKKQTMKTKKQRTDGHSNKVQYMSWEQFQSFVTNKGMWIQGDEIEVRNKAGCVISTTILTEDGEAQN